MPAQSSISSLLSLNTSSQPVKSAPKGGDDSFRRLLEQPSTSRQKPGEAGRETQARVKDAHAGAGSERSSAPNHGPESTTATKATQGSRDANSHAEDNASARNETLATHQSAAGELQHVRTEKTGEPEALSLEEAESLLANLSDQDWAKLSDDVKTVLTELKAQVDAGSLDPSVEEALRQLLTDLENGAPLDVIAQQLEAIPLDALPALAARFPQSQTLRDVLGKQGAAYLSQLTEVAQADQSRGGANPVAMTSLFSSSNANPVDAEGVDLTALLEAGKLGARSGREDFGLLLQSLAKGDGAKPVDIGASATSAGALAQLDNGTRPQPVAPTERQFTVQSDVRVPVGQGQWGQAVGQRVLWMASQKISSAELRLDPPDLGPMQVRVSSHQDQISVTFTSAQPAVREALDQSANRLREMFAEQGLDLVDVNVSDQSGRESMAGDGEGQPGGDSHSGGADEAEAQPLERIVSDRLVDHYA